LSENTLFGIYNAELYIDYKIDLKKVIREIVDFICFAPTDKYFNELTSKVCDGMSRDDYFETYKALGSFIKKS